MTNEHTIAPLTLGGSDYRGLAQNGAGAAQHPGQYSCSEQHPQSAPAGPQPDRWENIPAALRDRPQWCVAGNDKTPYTVAGHHASSTDPSTWTDFDSVASAACAKGLHIGYMLHENDPFTCIDMDVKDATPQEHVERYQRIAAMFDSYAERSRSGAGLHVWVEGKIGKGRKRDGVEVYSQARFMICTGDVYFNKPIRPHYRLLETLVAEMGRGSSLEVELEEDHDGDQDWHVAEQALVDTGEMGRLFAGDWQERYRSQSEADLALVKLLARCTESNDACWAAFRMSALGKREKAARQDYKRRTLTLARTHLANDAVQVAHGQEIAESLFWRVTATQLAPVQQFSHSRHFRLLSDADLAQLPPLRWLVKGVIPDASIGTIFGQSGTFKSFLALDLLAHVANGQPWFGHRVQAAPAVYVPFEGKGGIPKRVAAWKQAKSRQAQCEVTSGIFFITDSMNLRIQADRDKLVATLLERGLGGGMLCIDTLAQAGGGIDENSSEGMGEMIAIFQELQHQLGGTVLVIHHSGKVLSAGMRGWSGLRGALDFAIECQHPDDAGKLDAQFRLDKVKDDEDGRTIPFSMLRVHLGYDADDEDVTSLTVTPSVAPTKAHAGTQTDSMRDAEDDEFVLQWVKDVVARGEYPTGRSLEGQREEQMNQHHFMTQKRLRNAIHRLRAASRLVNDEERAPSGNIWIRANG